MIDTLLENKSKFKEPEFWKELNLESKNILF